MKKLTALLLTIVAVCLPASAQTNEAPAPAPKIDTGTVWADLALLTSSNLYGVAYGIYDTTTSEVGAGVGIIYDVTKYVGTCVRYDFIGGNLHRAGGTAQLQLPMKLFNKVTVVPFVFAGVAAKVAGKGSGSDGLMISGAGVAVRISTKWDLIGDYERWGGNNQIRFGALYKF